MAPPSFLARDCSWTQPGVALLPPPVWWEQVSGPPHDLHAGVDGGVGNEPLMDLMAVTSQLLNPDDGSIAIPGFYRDVRPLLPKEVQLYEVGWVGVRLWVSHLILWFPPCCRPQPGEVAHSAPRHVFLRLFINQCPCIGHCHGAAVLEL